MTDQKLKFLTIFFTVLLSSVFFWTTTNRFLYQSRADSEPIGVSFDQKLIQVSLKSGEFNKVPVDVNITTDPANHLTGSTIVVNYDPKMLTYIDEDESYVSSQCKEGGFSFSRRLKVNHDFQKGSLIITRAVDVQTPADKLPSGRFCWGTIVFAVFGSGVTPVSFETTDLSNWEIVGLDGAYSPRFDMPNMSLIDIINVDNGQKEVLGASDLQL